MILKTTEKLVCIVLHTPSVGLTIAHADILPILEENKQGDRELRFGSVLSLVSSRKSQEHFALLHVLLTLPPQRSAEVMRTFPARELVFIAVSLTQGEKGFEGGQPKVWRVRSRLYRSRFLRLHIYKHFSSSTTLAHFCSASHWEKCDLKTD